MPKSRRDTTEPATEVTPNQILLCLTLLEDLKKQFEQLIQRPNIDHADLDSLTRQFSLAATGLFVQQPIQSEKYRDWAPYHMFSYNQGIPQAEFDRQVQIAYREGARRTLTEIDSLSGQLRLRLQHAGAETALTNNNIQLLLQLCKRLPVSAKALARRRKDKQPFEITDEYDVQDLLKAIIRAYFKYSVSEEPIGKLAGAASRADFAIEDLGVIVEVKFVHGPNEQDRIVKQFAEDQQAYAKWEHLEHFIYVVYGSEDLRDPELLDELQEEKMLNGKHFMAYVVRC